VIYALLSIPPATIVKLAEAATKAPDLVQVSTGWGPGTYILLAILVAITPLVVALFRYLPIMRKLQDSSDVSLRKDLMMEIEKLRAEQRRERRECDRRLDAYQTKMDQITRTFFQFQLSLVRYLPAQAGSVAQQSVDHILEIISKPIEDFMSAPEAEETEGQHSA
jgi:hypothetical protein